jgi:acid phosphatase type 7
MPSIPAGRSARLRLLVIVTVVPIVVVAILFGYGALRDRMTPGTGDTPGTPVPSAEPSPEPSAGSGATPSEPATPSEMLLAVGDIARCDADGDERTSALAAGLPGTIALLGDTAYPDGTAKELDTCFGPSWGRLLDRTRWAAFGNHDYRTDDGRPLADYMGTRSVRDGLTYFSDTVGAWHVVVLDTNCGKVDGGCGADSPQVAWLRTDLAASNARCTVALFHQPRWSSGYHGNTGSVDAVWRTLVEGGVDLVLNGHEHDYERFAPLDADGEVDAAGTTEIVVGTGGGTLRGFRSTPATGSQVRKSTAYGVLEAELGQDAWTFRFIDADGNVLDAGSGTCR